MTYSTELGNYLLFLMIWKFGSLKGLALSEEECYPDPVLRGQTSWKHLSEQFAEIDFT